MRRRGREKRGGGRVYCSYLGSTSGHVRRGTKHTQPRSPIGARPTSTQKRACEDPAQNESRSVENGPPADPPESPSKTAQNRLVGLYSRTQTKGHFVPPRPPGPGDWTRVGLQGPGASLAVQLGQPRPERPWARSSAAARASNVRELSKGILSRGVLLAHESDLMGSFASETTIEVY